ncbi:hypothetical protein VTN02DRAFT_1656 [Thermoascus thermophilus]
MDRRRAIAYIIARTIAAVAFINTIHIATVAWLLFFSPNALFRRDRHRDRDRSRRGLRGVIRGRQMRWRNVRPIPFRGFGDARRPSTRPRPRLSPRRRTIATDSQSESEAVAV